MREHKYLNNGIYRVGEAARLTGTSYQSIGRWLFNRNTSVLDPDYKQVDNQKTLSFYDLIEVLIVSEFRKRGIGLREIRDAHTTLKNELETVHPFCHRDLFSDHTKIFSQLSNSSGETVFQEAVSGQNSIPEVIHTYLNAIDFDSLTNLARQWNIAQGVTLNPEVCFGKPVIANTRIPSHVIYDVFRANNHDTKLIANLYELSEDAVSFENGLKEQAAA